MTYFYNGRFLKYFKLSPEKKNLNIQAVSTGACTFALNAIDKGLGISISRRKFLLIDRFLPPHYEGLKF